MTAHTFFCVASCEFMTLLPVRRLGGGLRYISIIATSHKKGMCSH